MKKYIFALGFFIFFLGIFFILEHREKTTNDIDVIFHQKITFANEPVKITEKYEMNRWKLEKEMLITRFNTYQFLLYYKRLPLFFPYIESELRKAKLPDDLKYVAVAESALRTDVISTAGAGGIWQFMPDTAKKYGLIVTDSIDERFHVKKSTQAAVEYFSDLYNIFWNWTLVAAAYNRWENGLLRDMESQKQNSYYDLFLNPETSRYIYRIVAIKYLLKNIHLFIPKTGEVFHAPSTEILSISGPIENISTWAQEQGYIYSQIKELNPWILKNNLPWGTWEIEVMQE